MNVHVPYYVERTITGISDIYLRLAPRRRPTRRALEDCKIVSHRGEHDNRRVRENTMAAFNKVAEAGCWGIEFDLRWTRDLEPVVVHDTNAQRVFGVDLEIAETDLHELRQRIPEIPTLREVVETFGRRQHLMIELKSDAQGEFAWRAQRLREILDGLRAGEDYHFIALQLYLFEMVEFAGGCACVPVAELNIGEFSDAALARGFDGVCAQYLVLGNSRIRSHHHQGQKLGTGFASSRYCLYRELNRGVDWIFSNHALKLEAIRRELLQRY